MFCVLKLNLGVGINTFTIVMRGGGQKTFSFFGGFRRNQLAANPTNTAKLALISYSNCLTFVSRWCPIAQIKYPNVPLDDMNELGPNFMDFLQLCSDFCEILLFSCQPLSFFYKKLCVHKRKTNEEFYSFIAVKISFV